MDPSFLSYLGAIFNTEIDNIGDIMEIGGRASIRAVGGGKIRHFDAEVFFGQFKVPIPVIEPGARDLGTNENRHVDQRHVEANPTQAPNQFLDILPGFLPEGDFG